ncbi:MAG: N-6 DNA methylase [Microthrixaceae bacterium]
MGDPTARWLSRTASELRAAGVEPLAAAASLALTGLSQDDLPPWCEAATLLPDGPMPPIDPPDGVPVADLLGPLYELMLAAATRRTGGMHFTPSRLAAGLAGLAVDARTGGFGRPGEVAVDPACGAGAFLLAVARRMRADRGPNGSTDAGDVMAALVGCDLDADVLAVARLVLARWALDEVGAEAASLPEPALVCADALTRPDLLADAVGERTVALVVGNPPFLSQLRAGTRHDVSRRAALAERFGARLGAYTDSAALFLLAATELVAVGGVVCLIQPRSVLAARDATAVRAELFAQANLVAAWVGDGGFEAAVEVWAPVLARRAAGDPTPLEEEVAVLGGAAADEPIGAAPADALGPDSWAPLLAAADGLPTLRRIAAAPAPPGRLGEVVRFSAGFRDEYYGLLELAIEADDDGASGGVDRLLSTVPDSLAALVSSGLIDPGVCRWGRRPMRFGKRRWQTPAVRRSALRQSQTRSAAWAEAQLVPKVLVASQTRVIEAAPDGAGVALPLTPVIAGVPWEISLAHLLAVLCSPVSTVAVAKAMAGSGMGKAGVRVSTTVLGNLSLPPRPDPWDEAAALVEPYLGLGDDLPGATLRRVNELMVRAAGIGDAGEVLAWFNARS